MENGILIHNISLYNSDGVRRWQSNSGYEMFRFNVPGKGNY